MKAASDDYLMLRNSQNPTADDLLGREAEIVQSVQHPTVPGWVDYFEREGICFLIQGYVPGNSLAEMINRGLRFSEEEVRDILSQLLEILCFLHSSDNRPAILHRDLRLSNLILDDEGDLHLVDFGLAYRVGNNADEAFLRGISSARTRPAASPTYEIMRDDLTIQSDLFGAGVVAVDLFTNAAVASAGNPWEKRILISPGLNSFIRRLLGVEDAFPSSSEALNHLRGL